MNIQDIAQAQTVNIQVPEQGAGAQIQGTDQVAPAPREDRNMAGNVEADAARRRKDTYQTSAFADSSALYDVADIRHGRRGGVLTGNQVERRLTPQGEERVKKVVEIVLATERKSLRIYRKEQ